MDPKTFLQLYQDSLGHNLHRIGQLMREETSRVLQSYDLTPEQWQLLVALVRSEGLTPTELGTMTLRDKTTISRILPGLFRKGLIVRAVNPQDARSYVVKATESCKEMVERSLLAIKDHFEANVFSPLKEEEQTMLLQMLHKLRKGLGDL